MVSYPRSRVVALALALFVDASALSAAQTQVPSWPREPENPTAPRPAAPRTELLPLIGEYERVPGPADPGLQPPVHMYVLEQGGTLWTIVDRGEPTPFAGQTQGTRLVIGGVTYTRLQVGPAAGGQLHVTAIRDVAAVLKEIGRAHV